MYFNRQLLNWKSIVAPIVTLSRLLGITLKNAKHKHNIWSLVLYCCRDMSSSIVAVPYMCVRTFLCLMRNIYECIDIYRSDCWYISSEIANCHSHVAGIVTMPGLSTQYNPWQESNIKRTSRSLVCSTGPTLKRGDFEDRCWTTYIHILCNRVFDESHIYIYIPVGLLCRDFHWYRQLSSYRYMWRDIANCHRYVAAIATLPWSSTRIILANVL